MNHQTTSRPAARPSAIRRNAMLAPAVLVALSPLGVLHAQSTPAPARDPNASIYVLADQAQPTLDPAKTVGPVSDGTRYWLYDPLIRVTAAGTLEPGRATSWKVVNPTPFHLTLRKGVVFHDGTPFNAASVKATYERNKAFPGVTASWKQPMADVTGVSVVSDYEVQYQLNAPNPAFAFALTAAPGM